MLIVHNKCNVEGNNHGSIEHRAKMDEIAEQMSKTDEYTIIYKNKSLNTAGVKNGSRLRPDVIAVKKDGGFKIIEIASKSQKLGMGLERLNGKIAKMGKIPGVIIELIKYGG